MRPQIGAARGLAPNPFKQPHPAKCPWWFWPNPQKAIFSSLWACSPPGNMINLSAAKPQVISHSLSLFWALAEQRGCIFLGLGKPCSMDSCSQFSYSMYLWMWVGMAEFTVHSSDMRSKPCQRHFGVIEEQRCIEAAGRDLGRVWSSVTRNQVVFLCSPAQECTRDARVWPSLGALPCDPNNDQCCCYPLCVFNNSLTEFECASMAQGKLSWNRHLIGINQKNLLVILETEAVSCELCPGSLGKKSLSFLNIQLPLGHKELWWIGALYSFLLLLNSYLQTEVI